MFKRKSKSDKAPKAKKEKKPKKPREKRSRKAPRADGLALKKQPFDVYAAMLLVSLAAILVGIFLLGAELATYSDQGFFKGYPWWKAI